MILSKQTFRRARLEKFLRKRHLFHIFIGKFIKKGNKFLVTKHFVKALVRLKLQEKWSINYMLANIYNDLKPTLDLKSKFSSGINYLLPSLISDRKAQTLLLIWFCRAVGSYPDKKLHQRLYCEIKLISEGGGGRSRGYRSEHYNLIRKNKILLYRFKK